MNKTEQKKITLTITSSEGHTTRELIPAEAYAEIRDQVDNRGKWLYVNGEYTNVDEITEEDLNEEDDYIMTNAIRGGSDVPMDTPYRTSFVIAERDETTMDYPDIYVNVDSGQKMLDFHLDDASAVLLISHREGIVEVVKEILENTAKYHVKNLADQLQTEDEIEIVNFPKKMRVITSVKEINEYDLGITYDSNANTLEIVSSRAKEYAVLHHRRAIVATLRDKLSSLGEKFVDDMAEIVNL